MKKIVSAIFCLMTLAALAPAQVPDFSGVYILKSVKMSDSENNTGASNIMVGRTITKVVQDGTSVEIMSSSGGRGMVKCRYSLDGSEIQSAEPDATPTVERAEIKGKNLILRSSIKMAKGAPILRIQKWELSKDLKTVTVHQQTYLEQGHMLNDVLTVTYLRR
jgi:hypothetical protein